MFAPSQQPQLSKEDIEAGEREGCQTVQMAFAGAFLLFLSPHAVDWVRKLL